MESALPQAQHEGARRLIVLGVAIAAVTVAAQSAAHIFGVRILDDRVWNLNADVEGNAIAWAGSAATFAAAWAALALALAPERVDRRLLTLAAILAAFSLDDALEVHERIAAAGVDALGFGDEAQRLIWPPVYLPVIAAALILLVDASRRVGAGAGRMLRGGAALLVLAVGAELVAAFLAVVLDVERGTWPDVLQVVVEEGAEIGAWLLIAFGLSAALVAEAPGEGRA